MGFQRVRAGIATAAVLLAAAAPSGALEVHVQHDEKFDFASAVSFSWPDDSGIPGRARDPENAIRIRQAVNRVLRKRGLQQDDTDPDLRLYYYVGLEDRPLGAGGEQTPASVERTYEEGTLILEFFARDRERPVWHAAAEDPLDRDRLARQIRRVVSRMLKHYPPP